MADPKEKSEDDKLVDQFDLVEVDDKGKPVAAVEEPQVESQEPEDEEEDERAALSDDTEERKKERKLRADKRREMNRRREMELQGLRQSNAELAQRLQNLEQRGTRLDATVLSERIDTAKSQVDQANALFAQAVAGKDPAKINQALQVRDRAVDAYHRLSYAKGQMDRALKARSTETQERQPEAPDPATNRMVNKFTTKHSWFDLQGRDRDSRILLLIDQEVADEGFQPQTQEYWDEVEKRAAGHLPHRFKAGGGGGNGPNGGRRSPPVAGNGREGAANGRTRVYISPERKKAMQDAGAWDDPAKRARMLKRFADYDREHPQSQ